MALKNLEFFRNVLNHDPGVKLRFLSIRFFSSALKKNNIFDGAVGSG